MNDELTHTSLSPRFMAVLLFLTLCPIVGSMDRLEEGLSLVAVVPIVLAVGSLIVVFVLKAGRLAPTGLLMAAVGLSGAHFLAFRWLPIELFLFLLGVTWFVVCLGLFGSGARRGSMVAFGIAGVGFMLAGTEALLDPYHLDRPFELERKGRLTEPDPLITDRHIPGVTVRDRCVRSDGQVEYEVTYHIDEDHTRRVPGRSATGPDWRVFGGSYAFGMGHDDGQTMPALIQAANPDVRVFNHGLIGHGVADVYVNIEQPMQHDRDSNTSMCIYLMIGDHIRRAACPDSLTWMNWGATKPKFDLVDDALVYRGTAMQNLSFLRTLNVNLMMRSWVYNRLVSRPWVSQPEADRLAVALIEGMARVAQTYHFRFALVILPQNPRIPDDPGDLPGLVKTLTDRGVPVVDLATRFTEHLVQTGESVDDYFYIEHHPRIRYNQLMVEWMGPYLEKWASVGP